MWGVESELLNSKRGLRWALRQQRARLWGVPRAAPCLGVETPVEPTGAELPLQVPRPEQRIPCDRSGADPAAFIGWGGWGWSCQEGEENVGGATSRSLPAPLLPQPKAGRPAFPSGF